MKVKLKEEFLQMRFEQVYEDFNKKRLSCEEAALLLNVCPRTFLRIRQRYLSEDFDGHFDRRLGHVSNNRATDTEIKAMVKLYESKYEGFTVRHFHDHYKKLHKEPRSYNWCRQHLIAAHVVKKSKRGGPHRKRRERKPMEGMMVHQDGSTHRWLVDLGHDLDLIVTLDDATSEITSGFLMGQEGTMSSFEGIKETILKKGLFCSFYTDRGSHYGYTPDAGGKVDKNNLTQVGRALKELNIRHIMAYSPQARGRSERMFRTLQDRLPKELALQGIKTIEEANKYIREVYIPEHNALFAKPPKDPKSAYMKWPWVEALDEILCIKKPRVVQNDNTVQYNNKILQIPPQDHRQHYVRCEVEVRGYMDGTLSIFYGHL